MTVEAPGGTQEIENEEVPAQVRAIDGTETNEGLRLAGTTENKATVDMGTGKKNERGNGGEIESGMTGDDLAKPKFTPSGLLAAETNTVQSVDGKNSTVLKYNEPPEARKPVEGWRLYVFKSQGQAQSGKEEEVEILHIQRQSAYLIGRDRLVADIPVEHPSCSKQHAVIQYRLVQQKDEYGGSKGVVKPFIIDLNSTNGTHVNGEQIPTSRYYEVMVNDVIKFGTSNREYVLLHDGAAS
ncbi:SMAD/FHA domain-containing protein [Gymnopus androsaceus JB14]|uniref:SMAD/FHA domain-containing protein n=1 Tax=Gymnopus androsaceus JB14 TaxID=1447944 RepID=A0A6A4I9K5_9AGAR|nr:SMAD/FHA domain-containing protein [Gymnopus androsaceus JB14]